MAYIGRSIEYGNAVVDHFVGNGGATYTLNYDTNTDGVVISLDGVVQKNGTDFNITGTSLVFTSVVASPIEIQVVYTGLTLSFPTPSDGSVTDAKIVGMAASKLTGTIADARFPATLPAASGVNLTALNASNLGSGTVPTARLGTGTASSSTFLRGDQTYAEAGGIVKKVYAYEYGTRTSASSSANIFSFTTSWTPVNPSTNSFAIACSVPADSLNKDHIGVGLRFARSGGANYDFEGDGTFFSGHINSAVNCGNIFNISAGVLEVGTYTIYLRVFSANSTLSIFLPNSSDDSRLSAGTTAHLTITEYKN